MDLRLFVALELPPEVHAVLRNVQQRLAAHRLAVRWVDPDSAHLTLKFLGAVPASAVDAITDALGRAAAGHAPFGLRTTGVGAFPTMRQPRVVWLGLAGQLGALRDLQLAVEQFIAPLGYPSEQRPFNPHLTLGRTNKDIMPTQRAIVGRAIAELPAHADVSWTANMVSLMRSELRPGGARYTRIAAHALTPTDRLL